MNLALFDFDGTITYRDSFLLFLCHLNRRRVIFTILTHVPQIILYKLGKYPTQQLKETFLKRLLRGTSLNELDKTAERYCREVLPTIIRSGVWDRLDWHRQRGDTIAIVTASPTFMLAPWCRNEEVDLIGTEVETDPLGRVTGKISGKNCIGEEKVRRINQRYDIATYDTLFAYGDTASDRPMLRMAPPDNRFYKPFH